MQLNFLSSYLIDKIEPFAKWITISIFALALISIVLVYIFNKDYKTKLLKGGLLGLVLYSLILGIVLLSLEISKKYSQAYLTKNYVSLNVVKLVFIPLMVTLGLVLISVIIGFIVKLKKPTALKVLAKILIAICLISLVINVVLIGVYYNKHIKGDGYYTTESANFNSVALYAFALFVLVFQVVVSFILSLKDKKPFDTKTIAFAGVSVAISFVLSYIKLWEMPQGGSITLASALPLMIFAYVYGAKKGVFVGAIYGLLQAVQDPWLIHPAQFLLDYPLAFAMFGFAGSLSNVKFLEKLPQVKFAIGAIIAGILRFVCHVISGVFAFGAYALDSGTHNFLAYSLAYNSFVFVDLILVVVVGAIVFSSKAFQKVIQDRQQINNSNVTE